MNKQPSVWLIALVGILLVCCVFASIGTIALLVVVNSSDLVQPVAIEPTATLAVSKSVTPTRSATPQTTPAKKQGTGGSSSTKVTPTPVTIKSLAYNVFVPTPIAPAVTYAIGYESDLQVETYAVQGVTFNAISASLDANALSDPHEERSRYYARTDWHLGGNWYWKPSTRGCAVDHGEVSIQITMTLPALADQAAAPANVKTRWTHFIENTITHESGHVKIALQGAREYQRDLGNYPPAADCDVLKSQLQDLFERSFDSIDQKNVNYDAETRHGVSQGAVFP